MKTNDLSEKDVDVILIYPKTGMDFGATVAPPLYKKGYKVSIIDQRINPSWAKHLRGLLEKKPICVGISTMMGTQIYFAIEAAKIVRQVTNGKVPIVWGGAHPSSVPEQTLESEYVDVVCIGEGDITFVELVEAFARRGSLNQVKGIAFKDGNQTIVTPSRSLLNVEELLPVPWDLIDVGEYAERKEIGNITYTSILGNTFLNAIGGVSNDFVRFILKAIFTPISMFERFKRRRKRYSFAPELDVAGFLRKKLFYRNYNSVS